MFRIFGALAEFEHAFIRERTIPDLAAARARGRKSGCKRVMSAADATKTLAMLSDPQITRTEVAKKFGIARVTLNATLAGHCGATPSQLSAIN